MPAGAVPAGGDRGDAVTLDHDERVRDRRIALAVDQSPRANGNFLRRNTLLLRRHLRHRAKQNPGGQSGAPNEL